MSYTIMYGKQFLKTSRGIIPLALHGDNNVTEYVRGREVRERHWSVYANDKIEFTPDEYLAYSIHSAATNTRNISMPTENSSTTKGLSPGRRTESAKCSPSKRYAEPYPFSP